MKKMKTLLFTFMMLMLAAKAETPNPRFDREWRFPDGDGTILIQLYNTYPDSPSLFSLKIIHEGTEPNISKEAVCLESVLSDMKKEEKFPEGLRAVYAMFGGVNARELALAASKSKEWKNASVSDYSRLVVQLLNTADIYAPYNAVLEKYGLSIRVAAAEKIYALKPNTLGLENAGGRRLPSGATLSLVTKEKSSLSTAQTCEVPAKERK